MHNVKTSTNIILQHFTTYQRNARMHTSRVIMKYNSNNAMQSMKNCLKCNANKHRCCQNTNLNTRVLPDKIISLTNSQLPDFFSQLPHYSMTAVKLLTFPGFAVNWPPCITSQCYSHGWLQLSYQKGLPVISNYQY